MLQTIRERTQGWIAGSIITIIILTFALWGIHSYFVGGGESSEVAEVNGVDITKEQLAVAYERIRRQAQMQYNAANPITTKDEAELKNRALQALINMEVLKQASLKQGYRISDEQIDNYLWSMPEFQINGRFSFERFQEILSSTMLSTSEFLELIKTSLLIDQPRLGIILTSFVLPNETTDTIGFVNQERDINYINIPTQSILNQPINITTDSVKTYYNQHKKEFMTQEQVNVDYIELNLKDLYANFNPTESMLRNFYNENINSFTQSMQWKIADLLIPLAPFASSEEVNKAKNTALLIVKSLKAGEDIAKFSHLYPGTTNQNWLSLNQIPADLQKTVSQITKAQQISEPFRTSKGFAIVKVVDIQEPKMQSFEMVKDKVKEAYLRQHAEEKFSELRERLADTTYEHPDSLQFAAKALNLPIKTSEFFAKEKAGTDISQFKKVRDTAFNNDVLNLQNNSDVIQINPETVIVLRLKSHIASNVVPLAGVYKQIEDKLKTEEADLRAEKFAQMLRTKLQAGADPKQIAQENKVSWNNTGFIGRYSTKVDSAILDTAYRLPKPELVHRKPVYAVARLPNGYAVVSLAAVKQGVIADRKQHEVFAEQFQNSEGLLEYELYKQSVTNKSKIKMY